MAIQKQQAGVMPGAFPGGGAAIHSDAVTAIKLLTYAGLWGGAGRVVKSAPFDSLNDFEHANAHIWTVTGAPSS